MEKYLPYIVSVLCSFISGFATYFVARRQAKHDLLKIEKQYNLDIEKERERFAMEKEKMDIEHKHQMELLQTQIGNQMGSDLLSTITKAYMHSPEGQAQLRNAGQKKCKR